MIETAFSNGVRFYCGLCRPAYPPYVSYPTASEIDNPGDPSSWKIAADALLQTSVTSVFVSPTNSSTDLFDYLVKAGAHIIAGQSPEDSLKPEWIATVVQDPASALTQLWPDLMQGKGGAQLPMPLEIKDTSSGLLNQARQRLVDSTLQDLISGFIDPISVP